MERKISSQLLELQWASELEVATVFSFIAQNKEDPNVVKNNRQNGRFFHHCKENYGDQL